MVEPTQNRKSDEFEDGRKKWKIYFDLEPDAPMSENVITVRFRRNEEGNFYLKERDIKKLKQDLEDLGKFRIIKQGKNFLEK